MAPATAYLPIGHDNGKHGPPPPFANVPAAHIVHSVESVLPVDVVV